MRIVNDSSYTAPTALLPCTYLGRDGSVLDENEHVLKEHLLTLEINGKEASKIVCLREHLPELVLGHLLCQGYVRSAEEVISVYITADGRTAQAELLHGSSCGPEFVDSVRSGRLCDPAGSVSPIPWKKEWIFALADRFADGMPIHSQTWATHSAFLGSGGRLLFSCEEIGRHNAIDKAIGYALRENIDLKECYLYSSGRIPTDMVSKVISAGVPLLASKASPTADGVMLAKKHGLTLICAARRDRMKLFCGSLPEDH